MGIINNFVMNNINEKRKKTDFFDAKSLELEEDARSKLEHRDGEL